MKHLYKEMLGKRHVSAPYLKGQILEHWISFYHVCFQRFFVSAVIVQIPVFSFIKHNVHIYSQEHFDGHICKVPSKR